MELPIYDNASTYTCPENHAKYNTGICGSAINGLGERQAIRVVFHAYRPPQPEFEIAVQGLVVQDSAV